jgi:RNA polymerase sigma-70 factor (ECF subfamily)
VPITNQSDFPESDTEEAIDTRDLNVMLWQAIARLPDRCQTAFEYSRVDGLTYSQIAVRMGITQKAVEALISRSLKLLRASLADFLALLIFIIFN